MSVSETVVFPDDAAVPRKPAMARFADAIFFWSRSRAYVVGYGLILLIAALDLSGDHWLGVSRLYILPVGLLTWSRGRGAGVAATIVSLGIWMGADLWRAAAAGAQAFMPYWNASVHLVSFLVAVLVFSALRETLRQEKSLARTDFLTGVANRRFFFELADHEIRRARRSQRPFIVAYIDIDGFKAVNDKFGHSQGDALLRLMARTARLSLRESDVIARLGGDEFAILLPETAASASAAVMKKVQENIAAAMRENGWPVTFSIGTVTFNAPPLSVDEMVRTADNLMYAVKNGGKNTIKYHVYGKSPVATIR